MIKPAYIALLATIFVQACTQPSQAEPQTARTNGISLNFEGVRNQQGSLMVAIFTDKQSYEQLQKPYISVQLPASQTQVSFPGLQLTNFAVTLYHDENANQQLDYKDGYPIEGYGSSGDIGRFDTPTFEKAVTSTQELNIPVYYLQ